MEEAKNRAEIAYANLILTVISARKALLVSLSYELENIVKNKWCSDAPEELRWAGEVVLSGFLPWSPSKLQGMAEISA